MELLHYSAFTTPAGGGNAAGVVLDASELTDADMQALAAQLGYSESAFLTPLGERSHRIRYFSPLAEVDFCGHATVATAVALAEHGGRGMGDYVFHANVGEIPVHVAATPAGTSARLASVTPDTAALEGLTELLALLGWDAADLDAQLPSGLGFGGMWHPIVWAGSRERLAEVKYDFDGLAELMRERGWATVSLLFRESEALIHARNAFPIGGVVEDPATGAAAAALGGYLRAHDLLPADGRFVIVQGEDLGQPCRLEVDASGTGSVLVTGVATQFTV